MLVFRIQYLILSILISKLFSFAFISLYLLQDTAEYLNLVLYNIQLHIKFISIRLSRYVLNNQGLSK